jgi:hypothetical protein
MFDNAMYHSGHWVFNVEAFNLKEHKFQNIQLSDAWLGIHLQHFPIEPNLRGNNLLSINTHVNISPDFQIIQCSTGWLGALTLSATMAGRTRRLKECYESLVDRGYDEAAAEETCRSQIPWTEEDRNAALFSSLLALESASVHIPFGEHAGMSFDWSLLNVNYHFKDKAWFLSGNAGGSLGFSLGNHILLKAFAAYLILYEKNPSLEKGLFYGVSIGFK